jgi:hypothetical protein
MSEDCARILPDFIPTDGNTSVVDCISHTLLSVLAGTQQGRDWGKQMMDFETAARKVASTHPVLVLRKSKYRRLYPNISGPIERILYLI